MGKGEGVPRGEGLSGLSGPADEGVSGREGRALAEETLTFNVERRGVWRDDVDLPSALERRGRAATGEAAALLAEAGVAGLSIAVGEDASASSFSFVSTPSFHCKCSMTDLVAH